jgi:hypothetical protein
LSCPNSLPVFPLTRRSRVQAGQSETAGFREAGLNAKDLHEARIIRDAEIANLGVVRAALDEAPRRYDFENRNAGCVPADRAAVKRYDLGGCAIATHRQGG